MYVCRPVLSGFCDCNCVNKTIYSYSVLLQSTDLAKGSCIADYRWNSGAEYHGLKWDEHLPTDSAVRINSGLSFNRISSIFVVCMYGLFKFIFFRYFSICFVFIWILN